MDTCGHALALRVRSAAFVAEPKQFTVLPHITLGPRVACARSRLNEDRQGERDRAYEARRGLGVTFVARVENFRVRAQARHP